MKFKFCQKKKSLRSIAESLKQIAQALQPSIKLKEFKFMFIVKADQPDVPFQVVPEFTDSEGNAVPAPTSGLTYEAASTDDAVVSVIADPGGDPTKGTAHFGAPGQASLNFNILVNGKLAGALGAQFTVVVGDPAKLSGGKVTFEGLEDV